MAIGNWITESIRLDARGGRLGESTASTGGERCPEGLLDVIGLKLGFGLFAAAWAIITMMHGASTNWQMLAGLRGLMGFAEGTAQPGGMKAATPGPGGSQQITRLEAKGSVVVTQLMAGSDSSPPSQGTDRARA